MNSTNRVSAALWSLCVPSRKEPLPLLSERSPENGKYSSVNDVMCAGLCTGWQLHLFKTSSWLQNPSYVLAWPRQDRSGQSGTQVLKSTGGFEQVLLSPCTLQMFINLKAYFQGGISIGLRWRPRSPRPPGQSEWGQRGCSPASTRIPNWQSWAKFDKWTSVHAMSQQD